MLAVQVHVAWANAKNCSSFYGAYLDWTGAGMSGATTKRFSTNLPGLKRLTSSRCVGQSFQRRCFPILWCVQQKAISIHQRKKKRFCSPFGAASWKSEPFLAERVPIPYTNQQQHWNGIYISFSIRNTYIWLYHIYHHHHPTSYLSHH